MLTRWILVFAYFLKTSQRYRKIKQFFYDVLENPESRLKTYFDLFMIILILSSVSLLVYESRRQHEPLVDLFEHTVMLIFIVEYLLRAWLFSDSHSIIVTEYEKAHYLNKPFELHSALKAIALKKLAYVFSPFALVDLLAIVPSYREIRILRIFLIFRLFKLFRYFNSIKVFTDVIISKRFELITLLIIMGFLVIIATLAIYLFENPANGGEIDDLYTGFYWAIVTISTVGYGDIAPVSVPGRMVAMLLIMSGLASLAFFTSIIVSEFEDKILLLRENKTYSELKRYKDFVIICGFGRVGQEIAGQLIRNNQKFIIVDKEEANVGIARKQNYLVIQDDASKNGVLLNVGINQGASVVVCCTGDDIANVYITLSSRQLNKHIRIISRANRLENEKKLYQAGADHVIRPFEIAGHLAAEYVGQPVAFEAILGLLREQRHIRMETLKILPGSFAEMKSIQTLAFEQHKLKLIGVISANAVHLKHKNAYKVKNEHFYFNPDPQFIVQANDMLVVLGREYSISYFRNSLEKSGLKKGKSNG